MRAVRAQRGFARSSTMWPAYRDLPRPAQSSYWDDLSTFGTNLVSEVTTTWEAFADSADRAIELWRNSNHAPSNLN